MTHTCTPMSKLRARERDFQSIMQNFSHFPPEQLRLRWLNRTVQYSTHTYDHTLWVESYFWTHHSLTHSFSSSPETSSMSIWTDGILIPASAQTAAVNGGKHGMALMHSLHGIIMLLFFVFSMADERYYCKCRFEAWTLSLPPSVGRGVMESNNNCCCCWCDNFWHSHFSQVVYFQSSSYCIHVWPKHAPTMGGYERDRVIYLKKYQFWQLSYSKRSI